MNRTRILTIRVSEEEFKKLQTLAKRYDSTISWIVRQLIKTGFVISK